MLSASNTKQNQQHRNVHRRPEKTSQPDCAALARPGFVLEVVSRPAARANPPLARKTSDTLVRIWPHTDVTLQNAATSSRAKEPLGPPTRTQRNVMIYDHLLSHRSGKTIESLLLFHRGQICEYERLPRRICMSHVKCPHTGFRGVMIWLFS